uniref:Uncharacterized protein n=1 Tax=Bradyrhizobium symbiodeficiens TaxID=1404367 RepID=A0A6G9ADH8_9BRAD|nr:hypothetical protein HAV00_31530 [Bradyrhizobium symbiodeficiens]
MNAHAVPKNGDLTMRALCWHGKGDVRVRPGSQGPASASRKPPAPSAPRTCISLTVTSRMRPRR